MGVTPRFREGVIPCTTISPCARGLPGTRVKALEAFFTQTFRRSMCRAQPRSGTESKPGLCQKNILPGVIVPGVPESQPILFQSMPRVAEEDEGSLDELMLDLPPTQSLPPSPLFLTAEQTKRRHIITNLVLRFTFILIIIVIILNMMIMIIIMIMILIIFNIMEAHRVRSSLN